MNIGICPRLFLQTNNLCCNSCTLLFVNLCVLCMKTFWSPLDIVYGQLLQQYICSHSIFAWRAQRHKLFWKYVTHTNHLCCEVHFCRQHCSYAQIFHIPDTSKFIEFCHITSIEHLCCEVHFYRQPCPYAQIFHIHDSSKFIRFCHITSIKHLCCEVYFYRQSCPYAQIFHIHDCSTFIGFWHITSMSNQYTRYSRGWYHPFYFTSGDTDTSGKVPWSNYIQHLDQIIFKIKVAFFDNVLYLKSGDLITMTWMKSDYWLYIIYQIH